MGSSKTVLLIAEMAPSDRFARIVLLRNHKQNKIGLHSGPQTPGTPSTAKKSKGSVRLLGDFQQAVFNK